MKGTGLRIKLSGLSSIIFILTTYYLPLTTYYLYCQPLEPVIVENGVKFSFDSADAQKVTLGGEFNNWSPDKDSLSKNADGIWEINYPLKEGKYEYKFIIDGAWMDGANIVLNLKKDAAGKLFIPQEKGTSTQYSGKIRLGGKLLGLLYSRYDRDDDNWKIDANSSTAHLDLDWHISAFKEANCYVRTEVESQSGNFNLKFKQGEFNFTPEGVNLKTYYNEKIIQFDDPLKSLDNKVSIRYEKIDFFDESNVHLGYGFDTQGIYLSDDIFGFNGKFFYSNVNKTSQDDMGLRIKSPLFGDKIAFGTTFILNRGIPWEHSSSSNWFPNPEIAEGRSYDSSISTQPWYKGYTEKNISGIDFKFIFHEKLTFFSEYLKKEEKLTATRWNESKGTDVSIDKDWKIKATDDIIAGFKILPLEKLTSEISYRTKKQKLGSVLYSGQKLNSDAISGRAKYEKEKYFLGLAILQEKSDKIKDAIIIDGAFAPYYQSYYSGVVSTASYYLSEKNFTVMPFASLNLKDIKLSVKSKLQNNKIYATTISSGVQYIDALQNLKDLNVWETILEHSIKIFGSFYFEGSSRLSWLKDASKKGAYISTYSGLVYKPQKNVLIRVGWGLDPEGTDEDILEDIDKREEFLYNKYAQTGSIHKAEKLLELEKRISVRTEIKF